MRNVHPFLFISLVTLIFSCGAPTEKSKPVKPEENRFTPVSITPEGSLDEPMVFQVMPNESVYIIERKGGFKKFDPTDGKVKLIATIPVFPHNEQGLVGFTMDPNFNSNHWIYLYYSHPTESKFKMTRWELVNDSLIANSEKILFEIPCDREETSHTGGGMTWDKSGNLLITIGNNTANSYYSQTDQRPGRSKWDDQRGAANSNDLRGKILRIHPEPDGTYSIPEGNLFPKGTPKTRPEIYTMGNRNPWRVSIDSKTGFVYWGEIGPDADRDTENGPMGYDEFNQAKQPGFFGWPYFIGENQAYPMYDYAANKPGEKQNADKPINNSVNNTGINELPAAQPAFIAYPYGPSEKYPLVGSSSRCAIGGPIYHRDDFKNAKRSFPDYYEGKWLAADLSRFWIMAITIDESGNYQSMEKFLPDYHPRQPIDIKFGPDGDLYVLEYGGSTSNSASEAKLVRIEYNEGNRKPVVNVQSDKRGGAVPFVVKLTSTGTIDYDGDTVSYEWKIVNDKNGILKTVHQASAEVTFDKAGIYTATLTVTDSKGLSNSNSVKIISGNEPPGVSLTLSGNQYFYFENNKVQYEVLVSDKEDGSLSDHKILPDQVAVSIDYVSEGFDYVDVTMNHANIDANSRHAIALLMISKSDCSTCHSLSGIGVGPSFTSIYEKYKTDRSAIERLSAKIRNGGSGVWGGEIAMPAHPSITSNDAKTIAQYILSLQDKKTLPTKGTYVTASPKEDNGRGTYIFRGAYTDQGAGEIPRLSTEQVIILHSPILIPVNADIQQGTIRDQLDEYTFLTARPNSHLAFKDLDLTDIQTISIIPNWHLYDIYKGGKIEIRLDSPTGELIGETEMVPQQFNTKYRGAFGGVSEEEAKKVDVKKFPPLVLKDFFAPGVNKNYFTIPSKAEIKKTNGYHSVYFVFKNDQVRPEDSLFPLAEIEFQHE